MKAQDRDYDIEDVENGILGSMFMSPTKLAKGVWVLYADRINSAGVDTEEEFYDLLDDEVNKQLDACMKNAVRDFFTWGPEYISQVENLLNSLGQAMDEAVAEASATGTPSSSVPE